MLTAVLLLGLAAPSFASPYFRPLDYQHPAPVAGALLDPSALGNTESAALLPLVTHSPKDGCLLPALACEDWTPLAGGAAMNAGKLTFDVAPLANVLPSVIGGLLYLAPADWQQTWKAAQASAPTRSTSLTISAGPVWEYSQAANRGRFKIFSGLALQF